MAEAKRIFGVGFLFALLLVLLFAANVWAQKTCTPIVGGTSQTCTVTATWSPAGSTGATLKRSDGTGAMATVGSISGSITTLRDTFTDSGGVRHCWQVVTSSGASNIECWTTPVIGQIVSYAIAISQTSVQTGANITVTWQVSGIAPSPKDWVGLFKVGDTDSAFDPTRWCYTNGATSGTCATTAPSVAGQFEFRYLKDNGFVSSAKSPAVNVSAVPQQNAAPVVNAGPDMTIALPASAVLVGTVKDDGLPAGSKLTAAWTKVSGPGVVTFVADPSKGTTTASFSLPGSYVLNLSGNDGVFTVGDEMLVLINPAIVVPPPVAKEFNVTTTLKSLTITRRANETVGKITLPTNMKLKCNGNEATMTATTVTCP